MRIELRSPEFPRRLADSAAKLLPDFPRHRLLGGIAALYGHSSWEELVGSCCPDAPPFVFDQDLTRRDLEMRRSQQARAAATVLDLCFPYAYQFVLQVSATMDFRRARAPSYVHNQPELEALSEQTDLWRLGSVDAGHPLATFGITVGSIVDYGQFARDTLKGGSVVLNPHDRTYRGLAVILLSLDDLRTTPPGWSSPSQQFRGVFGKRSDFLEIAPIPGAHTLKSGYRQAQNEREVWEWEWTGQSIPALSVAVDEAKKAYEKMARIAGAWSKARRRPRQFDVSVRDVMGVPWFWPLQPQITSSLAKTKLLIAETYVRQNTCKANNGSTLGG